MVRKNTQKNWIVGIVFIKERNGSLGAGKKKSRDLRDFGSCPDRTRTHTNRTRICCATITPQGKSLSAQK